MNILLIAGHGAGDVGAVGNGYQEANLTRELVGLIKTRLAKYATVNVYDTNRNAYYDAQNGTLRPSKHDYVFEVHFNAGGGKGTEIYVTTAEAGTDVEAKVVSKLSKYFTNRGVKRMNFSVITTLKNQGMSTALLETCFIDSASDVQTYQKNKAGIADAIVAGIVEGFNLKASSSTSTTSTSSASKQTYRVRKSWADAKSQIGAYTSLENAKKACKAGYSVYDNSGKAVYTVKAPVVKWNNNAVVKTGDTVAAFNMYTKAWAGTNSALKNGLINIPALGGGIPADHVYAQDNKSDKTKAGCKVNIHETKVVAVDTSKNLVKIHDYWVIPAPLCKKEVS